MKQHVDPLQPFGSRAFIALAPETKAYNGSPKYAAAWRPRRRLAGALPEILRIELGHFVGFPFPLGQPARRLAILHFGNFHSVPLMTRHTCLQSFLVPVNAPSLNVTLES
jgi:hypothetical protein